MIPLWSLVIRVPGYRSTDPGFDSWRCHFFFFLEVVGLERGPLSFVRIPEELLQWKYSSSGSRKPRIKAMGIHPKKLALIWPTCGGRSVGIVCLRTEATEFSIV
jgi:hypothetical protein